MNIRHRIPAPLAALAAALVCVAVFAMPATARADYAMPSVDLEATVRRDGTVYVREVRTFEFDDSVNGVFWQIPFAENQQGATSTVSVTGVAVDGTAFSEASSASSGDDGVYTSDVISESGEESLKLKVFTPHDYDTSATIEVDYILTGGVMAWGDTAELYWKFIGPDWGENSENVTLTVSFDEELTQATPATEKTLRAWGHGQLTGNVRPDPASATVSFELPCVYAGEFAEARVAFPTAWVPAAQAQSKKRLSAILSEEETWASEANAQREQARMKLLLFAVGNVALALVFAVVIAIARPKRRNMKTQFNDEYFRDLPSDDHPAVLATLMAKGGADVPDQAFTATLMKATDERVISLGQTTVNGKEDYEIRTTSDKIKGGVTTGKIGQIDKAALDLFFFGMKFDASTHELRRPFRMFKRAAKRNASDYGDYYTIYKGAVRAGVEESGFIESDGSFAFAAATVVGIAIEFAGVYQICEADFAALNMIAFALASLIVVVGVRLSRGFKRLTPKGREIEAKCRALKKWLEDFTRLNEAMPGDLVLWNKLMVMAVALGVSKKTLRELADAVPPAVRDRDDFASSYPVYWWCYPHGGLMEPTGRLASAYGSSMRAIAASSDSSGGGFGGGFSGGGGGGVGGGGGGTF